MASRSRSRRGGGRRGGKSENHLPGIILICLAVAAFGVGLWFYLTAERPPTLDQVTLCPVDGPRSITVVLLDTSDALPDVTKREVSKLLMDTAEAVPEYGLLEIRLLDPSSASGRQVFAKCNPGNGAGLSHVTANPEQARQKFIEDFKKPVERSLASSLVPSEASTSPILSTLQSIAVDRFAGRDAAKMPKALVVVSDLMEHGPEYSHYQGDLSYERFRNSATYKRVRTDLQGASVSFYYIERITQKRPVKSDDVIKFWIAWLADSEGQRGTIKKLQGAG